jgi:alcohol dehydrogenase (NADP+)
MVETLTKTYGYAAQKENVPLSAFEFERRGIRPSDVKIDILYCGVCHSDVHQVKNEWKSTIYPIVPGHEIVGKVTQIGRDAKSFKVGEIVAVGCLVDSCRSCANCTGHLEQYCEGLVLTYNGRDKVDGRVTYGGYSTQIVVDEKFVLKVPNAFKEHDLPGVAPLLCAGITTYSPLRHWNVGKGSRVGVVGIGGLGHMAIKLAHALGAHVVTFTSSPNKFQEAKRLGADEVVSSKNMEEIKKFNKSLDFIIDTVSVSHSLDPFMELLKRDGTLCLVGAPDQPHPSLDVKKLIFQRRQLAGSLIGGLKETQEVLDFCGEHHILADIELIPIEKINEAYIRILQSDVKYRFVIDNASLKK